LSTDNPDLNRQVRPDGLIRLVYRIWWAWDSEKEKRRDCRWSRRSGSAVPLGLAKCAKGRVVWIRLPELMARTDL